jgi:hypothetical protein
MNEQFATLAQSVQKMKFCNIHWSNTINAGSRRTLSLHNDRVGILIGRITKEMRCGLGVRGPNVLHLSKK